MTEELSKGFTGIEINGVRFSNIKEILIYMNKQRDRIIELEKELNYAKTHCLFHSDCPNQKELASIKLKVDALSGDIPWSELKDKSEVIGKLTKAKEIIKDQKELLDRVLSAAETLSDFAQNTLHETEQFLKEN